MSDDNELELLIDELEDLVNQANKVIKSGGKVIYGNEECGILTLVNTRFHWRSKGLYDGNIKVIDLTIPDIQIALNEFQLYERVK